MQLAVADRAKAAEARTPVADHIKLKADLVRQAQAEEEAKIKVQMDKMLSSGTMDKAEYDKATLAILTGNKTLVTDLLKPVKPAGPTVSNAKEVGIIQSKHRELRKPLYARLQAIAKSLGDPFSIDPPEKLKIEKAELEAKIKAGMTQEAADMEALRQRDGTPATPGAAQGTGTITFSPEATESEQNILRWANELAGSGAKITGRTAPTTVKFGQVGETPAQQPPVSAPDAVWNEQHQCWTVVRNGRLIKVR